MFKLKAQQLYGDWLVQNPTPEDQRLKFTNKWIKQWENEYGLSLKNPNKHSESRRRTFLDNYKIIYKIFGQFAGILFKSTALILIL